MSDLPTSELLPNIEPDLDQHGLEFDRPANGEADAFTTW
jgi:hypothetical protein